MAIAADPHPHAHHVRDYPSPRVPLAIHPLHAVVLAGTLPLLLGALLTDLAYRASHQIQWSNFASWLIVGAMVLVGVALVFALVDLFRAGKGRGVPYFVLLVVTFALGVVNALVHGQDAWAIMPEAVVLSAVVFLLACVATWLGFSGYRRGAP